MNCLKRFYIACCRFRHRHGFGVHSPAAFYFITNVVYGAGHYYAYEELEAWRRQLPKEWPRYPLRINKLLFRLVNFFQPQTVVEVGTGSGLSIRYMAAAKRQARYVTVDNVHHQSLEKMLRESSIEYRLMLPPDERLFQDFATIDLLHIAHTAAHRSVFDKALPHLTPRSVVIVEGIHASKEKYAWWKQVVADNRIGVTYDLYDLGLICFDKSRPKQHYIA